AYAEFLGYSPTEMTSIDIAVVTRPDDVAWTRRYIDRLVRGEIDRFDTDKLYVRKSGQQVRARLSSRAMFDEDGRCRYLIGAIVPLPDDIASTAPEVAERLLEFGQESILLVDADGQVRATGGAARTGQGGPRGYWTDRRIQDLVPTDEWERLAGLRTDVATPGSSTIADVSTINASGRPMVVEARVVNCVDDPTLGGFVVVARDVTEERAAAAALAEQRRRTEEAMAAQNRLLATVSHELRNPLHALLGTAELLAAEELNESAAPLAATLVRQLAGLATVTNDLLDSARISAGEVTIERRATDLTALVSDVVELGRVAAGPKTIIVSSHLSHGVPAWVSVDADRLRQVLSNLIGNAVKFTAAGSVQLIVRPGAPGSLVFSVIDTGVGIPEAERAAVLEAFSVGSNSGADRGAGLGLSIVQHLVSAMGGSLRMTSEVAVGTTFDVHLPVGEAQAPSAAASDRAPVGLRILVVEDNPVNQQLARRQLERLGQLPVVVESGEEGLDLLMDTTGSSFDLVLLDQQLPGWSGTETAERIRSLPTSIATIPIVGISASTTAADRDVFIAAGMDDFIAKPATLSDLSRVIASAVRPDGFLPVIEQSAPPSPPRDQAVEVTDPDVLAALSEDLGGTATVREIVVTFLEHLAARIAAITDADDDPSLRRAAHALGSSALLVGARPLGELCRAIERGSASSTGIGALAERTRTELKVWLGR
ncbi:MAG: hypothetical protein RLZZ01_20, partial [Actinomycetota bacterium]